MGVRTTHSDYDKMVPIWKRIRDVLAGHDAIQEAGRDYLPELSEQDENEYQAYKGRAAFFNATSRVSDTMSGLVFRKPPIIEAAPIQDIADNITLNGTNLTSFAEDIIEEQLGPTRSGVLVDYPSVDTSQMTAVQVKALGLRPYAALYKAEDILDWRYTNGVLSMVKLREIEEVVDPQDEFLTERKEIIRVLDMFEGKYRQRVYKEVRKDGKDTLWELASTVFPRMNGKPFDYIPFVFFGERGNSGEMNDPVLNDLAVVNLAHYRNTADYEHGLHFTGLPTAVVTGLSDNDAVFRIGSGNAWVLSDPQAKAFYMEFTGQGLETMRKALQDKQAQMAALGARVLVPEKRDAEAAETETGKRQGEISTLASLANATSRGLTRVLEIMRDWQGVTGDVSIKLNTDFNVQRMSAQEISALLQAVLTQQISSQSLYEALVKGEVINGERSFEEEQALARDNVMPAPTNAPADDDEQRPAG